MEKHREEDYNLDVTIENDQFCLPDIPCKIYIPKKNHELILIRFFFTKAQWDEVKREPIFSVRGEEKGTFVIGLAKIKAEQVYVKDIDFERRGSEFKEVVVLAEARNLIVENRFRSQESGDIGKSVGQFWLTSAPHLFPMRMPKFVESEPPIFETIRQTIITLPNGVTLTFDTLDHSHENEEGDKVISTQLVANFELSESEALTSQVEETLQYLNDFLLIVSFVSRKRCVCTGWEFQNKLKRITYYRRDVAIPIRKKEERDEPLLFLGVEQFIKIAYEKFNELEPKEHLRRAISYLLPLPDENRSIESSYIILFAALETLVLDFRRKEAVETILPESDWNQFRDELKRYLGEWLKKHPQFSQDSKRRDRIYKKLDELNRISLSDAFEIFCSDYSLNLEDLWPVVGKKDGISLSEIRNKIVHGETFQPVHYLPIMTATNHLQWIVERMFLAVLGCDIAKTEVSESQLSKGRTKDQLWKADLKSLSENLK